MLLEKEIGMFRPRLTCWLVADVKMFCNEPFPGSRLPDPAQRLPFQPPGFTGGTSLPSGKERLPPGNAFQERPGAVFLRARTAPQRDSRADSPRPAKLQVWLAHIAAIAPHAPPPIMAA